jgi:aspartate aminotransferase
MVETVRRSVISGTMQDIEAHSSWIRKMFVEGAKLKARVGPHNVIDLSLGNPDQPPSPKMIGTLVSLLQRELQLDGGRNQHAYMPNAGFPDVRSRVADYLNKTQNPASALTGDQVIMTCGAGGALNVIFKALLNPGDEVLTPDPFFPEYEFYAANHGGKLVTAPTGADFELYPAVMERAIGPRTKAILINSPNNPTGVIYREKTLRDLADIIRQKENEYDQDIFLVADQPYAGLVFDGGHLPSIFEIFPHSLLAYSFSKDLGMAGERIGYIGINPSNPEAQALTNALITANRILGFVNAPALAQRLAAEYLGEVVGLEEYQSRRNLMYAALTDMGYEVLKPQGTFYMWVKTPIDDLAFVEKARDEHYLLAVPGRGFGQRGRNYIRLALCVPQSDLLRSLPAFQALAKSMG